MDGNNPQRPPSPAFARKQFFDVVRPGRAPASATSRPVLASNRPPVQDTSMKLSVPPAPINSTPQPQEAFRPVTPVGQPGQSQTVTAPPPPAPRAPSLDGAMPRTVAAPQVRPQPQNIGQVILPGQPAAPQIRGDQPSQQLPDEQKKHSILSEVFAIFAIVILIAIILNILVDANVLDLPIPHTNFFDY